MEYTLKKIEKMNFITIKNDIGFEVTFSRLGASILTIYYNGVIMTTSPKSMRDFFKKDLYFGKTIGPIANRIENGIIKIGDKEYQMELNEGNNTLHSGTKGISNKIFDYNINENKEFISVYMMLKDRKMKNGLPGNVTYLITYTIPRNEAKLLVNFNVSTDADTVIAVTNHSFFCLGEENLNHLSLKIPASKYIESDKDTLIPRQVKDMIECLDFRNKKNIMKDINDDYLQNHKTKGYDHHFIFDNNNPIVLESPKYVLEIRSNFSGCQIYSDNYEDGAVMLNSPEKLHRGIAIEPQDSTLDRKVLSKVERFYSREIEYKFVQK